MLGVIISISQHSWEKIERVLWRILISMQLASMSGVVSHGFFSVYGRRHVGARKHVAMAEKTIQNIFDARDRDGGEQVSLNENKAIS